ncbi:MAG: M48 family metalloprotease [Acidobacteriota bacterium]
MSRNFLPLCWLLFLGSATTHIAAESAETLPIEVQTAQAIADEFRARLEIADQVFVQVVSHDRRLVSVRRSRERKDLFLLSFDQGFLTALSPEEIRAAIAHEFGHIWIFTHHPYLQTEALANRTAMQLVSRESLKKVYVKVTQFGGKRLELRSD